MKAVHFGAGNIGRGFLGQLYSQSGYSTTFIEAVPAVVDALNAHGGYLIQIAEATPESVQVENVSAVLASDLGAVATAIAAADIVSTAVGVNVLAKIAESLALGIQTRFKDGAGPLDIVVCENLIDAGAFLREEVRKHLSAEWHGPLDDRIGFVEASIGRMVPIVPPEKRELDPLWIAVEAYCELPVDKDAFRGQIPAIRHLKPMSPFKAYVDRKLFVHNLGHATAAYLGYLEGYEFIWQAVENAVIRQSTADAMTTSALALSMRHGLSLPDLYAHVDDLLRRFANRALGDQVLRVAADPIRKLGSNDRFLGAIKMCLETQVDPTAIIVGVRAALRFNPDSDPSASRLAEWIQRDGVDAVVRSLAENDRIADEVLKINSAIP